MRSSPAGGSAGTGLTWEQLTEWIGPVIRGWMTYYGRFRHSVLDPLLSRINYHVQKWIRRKYRRLKTYKVMKLADQLHKTGVTLNAVHPGLSATGIVDDIVPPLMKPSSG